MAAHIKRLYLKRCSPCCFRALRVSQRRERLISHSEDCTATRFPVDALTDVSMLAKPVFVKFTVTSNAG